MTYDEKKVKKILNESDSDVNKKCEILKFDKKHEYCDCSFYYGNYIKTSRKIVVLHRIQTPMKASFLLIIRYSTFFLLVLIQEKDRQRVILIP